MSQRLEAAVKAWDRHWGDRYGDEALEEMGEEVKVALDAADAVLFDPGHIALVASTTVFSVVEIVDLLAKLKQVADV